MSFRLLSLLFVILAFLALLAATLTRYFRPEFIHHDPITIFKLSELFFVASIALVLHDKSGKSS